MKIEKHSPKYSRSRLGLLLTLSLFVVGSLPSSAQAETTMLKKDYRNADGSGGTTAEGETPGDGADSQDKADAQAAVNAVRRLCFKDANPGEDWEFVKSTYLLAKDSNGADIQPEFSDQGETTASEVAREAAKAAGKLGNTKSGGLLDVVGGIIGGAVKKIAMPDKKYSAKAKVQVGFIKCWWERESEDTGMIEEDDTDRVAALASINDLADHLIGLAQGVEAPIEETQALLNAAVEEMLENGLTHFPEMDDADEFSLESDQEELPQFTEEQDHSLQIIH